MGNWENARWAALEAPYRRSVAGCCCSASEMATLFRKQLGLSPKAPPPQSPVANRCVSGDGREGNNYWGLA